MLKVLKSTPSKALVIKIASIGNSSTLVLFTLAAIKPNEKIREPDVFKLVNYVMAPDTDVRLARAQAALKAANNLL